MIKQSMNISLGLCKIVELADEKNKRTEEELESRNAGDIALELTAIMKQEGRCIRQLTFKTS